MHFNIEMTMGKLKPNLRTFIVLSVFILSACNALDKSESFPKISGLSSTLAIQTMVADPDLLSLVLTPTSIPGNFTPTQIADDSSSRISFPVETDIPLLTHTPIPSLTPIETPSNMTGSNTTTECINAAEFIQDVTIPDDTIMKPKEEFTKIWKLRNIGTCVWTPDYAIVFIAGDQMEGISPKKLDTSVAPGENIDISIDLVAPSKDDYYQGNWMLQNESGETFGTGSDASNPFWVSIKTGLPSWRDIFQGGGGGGGGRGGCLGGG